MCNIDREIPTDVRTDQVNNEYQHVQVLGPHDTHTTEGTKYRGFVYV